MAERPILFSGPMVRAILVGAKTQTRRLMKPQPVGTMGKEWPDEDRWGWSFAAGRTMLNASEVASCCPYGWKRDRLWVREAWRTGKKLDKVKPADLPARCEPIEPPVLFLADGSDLDGHRLDNFGSAWGRYRHGRFMPRWASRLTLEIAEVRVQRLQEITAEDAAAEGIGFDETRCDGECGATPCALARGAFERLWDSINGDRATWASNPWVWALTFRRLP